MPVRISFKPAPSHAFARVLSANPVPAQDLGTVRLNPAILRDLLAEIRKIAQPQRHSVANGMDAVEGSP